MKKQRDGIRVVLTMPDAVKHGIKDHKAYENTIDCGDVVGVEHIRNNKVIYEE